MNPRNSRVNRVIASPVVAGGLIYAPSRRRPLIAIRAGGRGDVTETHRAWALNHGPDVPTPVTDGTYLYLFGDKGIVWCHNAKTGELVWGPQRIEPAIYSASPVLADGKLYITSEDGVTTVLKAGPTFQVLAKNNLDDYSLSSPAISDGQIFLRMAQYLYCIGKRVKQ